MSRGVPKRKGEAAPVWAVTVPKPSLRDEAVRVCLADLKMVGKRCGLTIKVTTDLELPSSNAIIVGDHSRNQVTRQLHERGVLRLHGAVGEEGYEIVTLRRGGRKTIVVAGGSIIGDVYGLYRIWDAMRIFGCLPTLNLREQPELAIRYTRIPVRNEDDIRRALRYRLNLVFGENPLNLVPWDSHPEAEENARHREETRKLARYAHSLHMRYLAFGTEFTYHPSLLREFGASLSVEDPKLWDAVRAKFRRLLEAVPELDGVETFLGEEQAYWGAYRTFDPIHGDEACDWSLEKRYRTFVKAVWDVVVGEFGKILFQRTWVTNAYEQHSQPDVYRRIFTEEVPTRNLYLVPSFTQNDRWWFQPFNPTINQTPHDMLVVCETMDYHDGASFFPTFPGLYFAAGFEHMLGRGRSNLKGASLDMPAEEGWDTRSLTAYTVSRLMWNHKEDPRDIARDFCAIQFGRRPANRMAHILLLSPVAYKYGLYIEPVAYGAFSSLPHIRTGSFVAEGYPSIDKGRAHIEFLKSIYLRCKPWIRETIMYLDHGLLTARAMERAFSPARRTFRDHTLAARVGNSLRLMRLLIQTNNFYVKTSFAYFRYRESPTEANRKLLRTLHRKLKASMEQFCDTPGCIFELFGPKQLAINVSEILKDRRRAEQALASAPTTEEIEREVAEQQRRYREILDKHRDRAQRILYWEGRVDGQDIISVRGSDLEIEHLRWDPIYMHSHSFVQPLPSKVGSVVIEDIESEPMHPFVLQQPRKENGYTAKVYLNDVPGGAHWVRFYLYFIEETPDALGLRVPWDRPELEGRVES